MATLSFTKSLTSWFYAFWRCKNTKILENTQIFLEEILENTQIFLAEILENTQIFLAKILENTQIFLAEILENTQIFSVCKGKRFKTPDKT